MRKILLVLVSILFLANLAQAAEWTDEVAKQLSSQSSGRAVKTDESEMIRIWYDGAGINPLAVVTSNTSWGVHDTVNGVTALTGAGGTTVQDHVNTINALTGWHAVVGRDVTPNSVTLATLIASAGAVGNTDSNGYSVYNDTSTLLSVSAGVRGTSVRQNRIKQYTHSIGQRPGASGTLYVTTWDGNTMIDSRIYTPTELQTVTSKNCSPNTVVYSSTGEKGISATKGNNLVVNAHGTADMGDASDINSTTQLSILYDQL